MATTHWPGSARLHEPRAAYPDQEAECEDREGRRQMVRRVLFIEWPGRAVVPGGTAIEGAGHRFTVDDSFKGRERRV